jgi:hypothetical protein
MRYFVIIFFALILMLSPASTFAETKPRVVDSKSIRKSPERKPFAGARIINLKGRARKTPTNSNNICPSVDNRFYCRNVGKDAIEEATGEVIGEITGVAWRTEGETMFRHLPVGWLERMEGEQYNINSASEVEGFFYIVKAGGQLAFLVECQRISAQK